MLGFNDLEFEESDAVPNVVQRYAAVLCHVEDLPKARGTMKVSKS
jgi:hypothetical protein